MYYLNKAHFLGDHSIRFFGIVHIWTHCGVLKVVSKRIGGLVVDVHGSNCDEDVLSSRYSRNVFLITIWLTLMQLKGGLRQSKKKWPKESRQTHCKWKRKERLLAKYFIIRTQAHLFLSDIWIEFLQLIAARKSLGIVPVGYQVGARRCLPF